MPRPQKKAFLSMHVRFPLFGVLTLFLASGPALALDAWTQTIERGLPVISLKSGDGALRIVCDPDRVFGPTPNGAVIVNLHKDKAASTIVFLAKSGEQARLAAAKGTAAQQTADAAEWAKMVAIVKVGGEFAVVSTHDSLSFETAPLPDFACE